MYTKKFIFKNVKIVFSSLLIPPPPTPTRVSRLLAKNKKHGFTLAETLITLTIIGIIAAMTVPNLMQNWEKQVRLTQIKTAYTILQNATALAVLENGHPSRWTSSQNYNTETYVKKYFIPYVKVAADCGTYDEDTKRACFKQLPKFLVEPNSETEQRVLTYYYYSVKLQNGMIVSMRHSPNGARVYFLVDVNGNKGPSKAGSDIFGFQGDFTLGKNFITTNISNDDTFNDYHEVMTTGFHKCNATTGEQNGPNCTHLIYLNNWEFPDDYPVKKF